MLKKLFFSVFAVMSLAGCSSINYQSLSKCSGTEKPYAGPAKDGNIPYGTIESIHQGTYGAEDWHAVITHVDCQKINEPWEIVRLPVGKHSVRVRFDENGKNIKVAIKPTSFDESAQLLDVDIIAGKKYTLHAKTLVMWDIAYWIILDGKVVAHTPNFEASFVKK